MSGVRGSRSASNPSGTQSCVSFWPWCRCGRLSPVAVLARLVGWLHFFGTTRCSAVDCVLLCGNRARRVCGVLWTTLRGTGGADTERAAVLVDHRGSASIAAVLCERGAVQATGTARTQRWAGGELACRCGIGMVWHPVIHLAVGGAGIVRAGLTYERRGRPTFKIN